MPGNNLIADFIGKTFSQHRVSRSDHVTTKESIALLTNIDCQPSKNKENLLLIKISPFLF